MDVLAMAILAVFLLGLSLLFLSGRGSVFVAGFNTAAPSQRARCDERGLCRGMGGMTFGCAVGLALMAFGLYIEDNFANQEPMGERVYLAGLMVSIVFIVFGVWCVNARSKKRR